MGKKAIISSTFTDLKDYRAVVINACRGMDFIDECMERSTSTHQSTVENSMKYVEASNVYIGIFAFRYGTVPDDAGISITEMELIRAEELGHDMLIFIADEDEVVPIPNKHRETGVGAEKLRQLKERLDKTYTCARFTTPDSLNALVIQSLSDLRDQKYRTQASEPAIKPPTDPNAAIEAYRERMIAETGSLSLMGLGSQVGDIKLAIGDAYVELETKEIAPAQRDIGHSHDPNAMERIERDERVTLTELFSKALANQPPRNAVLILGDPGAGKTTAARRIFWELSTGVASPADFQLPDDVFPVYLRLQLLVPSEILSDPAQIRGFFAQTDLLKDYLDRQTWNPDLPDELGRPGAALWKKGCLLWILDGLDEIPNAEARDLTLAAIAKAVAARHPVMHDRFLVTSRFSGTEGEEVRVPDCFARFEVKSLPQPKREELIRRFFENVAKGIVGDKPEAATLAAERSKGLLAELDEWEKQPRIRDIAGNPLILTIICTVYWDFQHLPHGRADLYDRCVSVFLEHRPAHKAGEQERTFDQKAARSVLGALAWWLHEGKVRGSSLEDLAEVAAPALAKVGDSVLGGDGENFIREHMGRQCGILVSSAGQREFLHLTFQEFFAAEHARTSRQMARLADGVTDKWWREPAAHALRLGGEFDAQDFFEQLLTGGTLQALADEPEYVSELIRSASEFPTEPFMRFFESGPAEDVLRLVVKGLLSRPVPSELAAATGKLAAKSTDREIHAAAVTILKRAGLEAPDFGGEALDIWVDDGDDRSGITFVRIPAGTFRMGGDEFEDEKPIHDVTISSDFWLGTHPVTNGQYARFLEAHPEIEKPKHFSDSRLNGDQQPVINVSWHDAQSYCNWFSFTLPSEAQWEYGCRAGTETRFSFGDQDEDLSEHGWFSANSEGRTHDVGTKKPNPWGLYDMHGNVWEWCQDSIREYSSEPLVDPLGPTSNDAIRVLRGGSGSFAPARCRSAFRLAGVPGNRSGNAGFRVVFLQAGPAPA